MATTDNFSMYAGDSRTRQQSMVGDDNITNIDLTGNTEITAEFKVRQGDPDSASYITLNRTTGGITVLNAALGYIQLNILPDATAAFTQTVPLQYAVKAYFSSTNKITGVVGTLTVNANIVRKT